MTNNVPTSSAELTGSEKAAPSAGKRPVGRPRTLPRSPVKRVGRPRSASAPMRDSYNEEDTRLIKLRVIALLCTGGHPTLRSAARVVEMPDGSTGIAATTLHNWKALDKNFAAEVKLAKEVVADYLEEKLLGDRNTVAAIFMLKGIRPEYRDNAKLIVEDGKTQELLAELRKLGADQKAELPKESEENASREE